MATFKKQLTRYKFESLLAGETWEVLKGAERVRQTVDKRHRTWTGPSQKKRGGTARFVRTGGEIHEEKSWRALALKLNLIQ